VARSGSASQPSGPTPTASASVGRVIISNFIATPVEPGTNTPGPGTPLSSFATAATVCSLIPPDVVQRLAPGAHPLSVSFASNTQCVATALTTNGSAVPTLTLTLTSVAVLGTFQSWVDVEDRGPQPMTVKQQPHLGRSAVSLVGREAGNFARSEALWRQGGYQLELVLTASGDDQTALLLGVATGIYNAHPH